MAPTPLGGGAIGRVALMLAWIAITAGTIASAAACARSGQTHQSLAVDLGTEPISSPEPQPSATPSPDAEVTRGTATAEQPPAPKVAVDGTLSWAYLDRVTGARYGSANADVASYAESMVKAWLAADELSRSEQSGRQPDLDLIAPMIRDSDDDAAETIWLNNGADDSIARMIHTCQLTDTTVVSGWWSLTMMSARDAVRLGECIANGVAAGPHWTDWLMDEMRQVRGEGRFGIVDGVDPTTASTLAIKNGWTLHLDQINTWQVNCLAIDSDWVLAVMMTYPGERDLAYGANLCASVAEQFLGPLS